MRSQERQPAVFCLFEALKSNFFPSVFSNTSGRFYKVIQLNELRDKGKGIRLSKEKVARALEP